MHGYISGKYLRNNHNDDDDDDDDSDHGDNADDEHQNGHNLPNYWARRPKFCMVLDLDNTNK